jgi:4-hydroxy-3-methylbut-2-enyl diphosphate reductase
LAATAPLTILGELVHNPIVRERLQAQGAREASLDIASAEVLATTVMITAHGASDAKRRQWQQSGFQIADGTCPLVRHAHAQLRALVAAGYTPVVIGQAGHVEVRGLMEDFPGANVISTRGDIALLPVAVRYGVISQTTQPIDRVRELVAELRHARRQAEVRFVDTVCKPTKDRQSALQRLIVQVQVVVMVGGRASNNTRQLVATCRAARKPALHIERAAELVAEDFSDVESVGVTAGTSTLHETVDAVVERLRQISNRSFQNH